MPSLFGGKSCPLSVRTAHTDSIPSLQLTAERRLSPGRGIRVLVYGSNTLVTRHGAPGPSRSEDLPARCGCGQGSPPDAEVLVVHANARLTPRGRLELADASSRTAGRCAARLNVYRSPSPSRRPAPGAALPRAGPVMTGDRGDDRPVLTAEAQPEADPPADGPADPAPQARLGPGPQRRQARPARQHRRSGAATRGRSRLIELDPASGAFAAPPGRCGSRATEGGCGHLGRAPPTMPCCGPDAGSRPLPQACLWPAGRPLTTRPGDKITAG